MMKKLLLIVCATILSLPSLWAYDFEVDGIYYNINGTEATVTYRDSRYNSYSGDVVIQSTVLHNDVTYNVTSIGDNAFYSCRGLNSITIPENVTTIGENAFNGCHNLASITIPKNVTLIAKNAFYHCI